MLSLDKVLGLAGMGSTIINVSVLKRFLSGIVLVVAFTALSGTMAGMLVMGALYGLYVSLVHHGLDPIGAILVAGGLAVIIVAGFGVLAALRWYQLREMPKLVSIEAPLINRASKLAEAFIDGLMADRTR